MVCGPHWRSIGSSQVKQPLKIHILTQLLVLGILFITLILFPIEKLKAVFGHVFLLINLDLTVTRYT